MKPFLLQILLLGTPVALTGTDRVVLYDGDSLTGTIAAIGPDARVTLKSANVASPIELKQEAIERIVFDTEAPPTPDYTEVIALSNGDKIPGKLALLNANTVEFETSYANTLTIPRGKARAIDFGARPQRLVFSGPGKLSDWTKNDNWQSSGKTLTNNSSGSITHADLLPSQFILRFRIEWEGNPSLRFYFCDDLLKVQGEADRYYFEFNSAGMQIKRQTAGDERRWSTIASIPRKPSSFPDSRTDIELRVDRDQGLIYVYVDGKSEGHHRDHIPKFPTGSGIMLQSLAGGEMKNIVSNIEIYDWDAVSQIRSDEGHDDKNRDSLISTSGERFSGSAEELTTRKDGSAGIVFSSPHSDDSFTIPKSRISTLYFRMNEDLPATAPVLCNVFLTNSGQLQLTNIMMSENRLSGTHPILGPISVDQDTVARIVFVPAIAAP